MSTEILPGVVTAILLVAFVAAWAWAFAAERRVDFDEAARLPLERDGLAPGRDER